MAGGGRRLCRLGCRRGFAGATAGGSGCDRGGIYTGRRRRSTAAGGLRRAPPAPASPPAAREGGAHVELTAPGGPDVGRIWLEIRIRCITVPAADGAENVDQAGIEEAAHAIFAAADTDDNPAPLMTRGAMVIVYGMFSGETRVSQASFPVFASKARRRPSTTGAITLPSYSAMPRLTTPQQMRDCQTC